MKTRFVSVLFALAILAVAGFAWAAQSTVPVASQPEAPEASAPVDDGTIVPAEIEGLFVEPIETTGACCRADCDDALNACRSACGLDFGCWAQCRAEYDICISYC